MQIDLLKESSSSSEDNITKEEEKGLNSKKERECGTEIIISSLKVYHSSRGEVPRPGGRREDCL